MKQLERILAIVVVIAIAMKVLLIAGGGVLLVISLSTLSLFYYFLGFAYFNEISFSDIFKKEAYKGIRAIRIIGSIGLGWSLSALLMGVLFRFQSYPGGRVMIFQGIFFLLICLIVAAVRNSKAESGRYTKIFNRIAIVGIFGLIISLIPSIKFIEVFHRDQPAYVEALRKFNEDPTNKEYQAAVERQRDSMYTTH
jgi:hypothetical protein